jgi:hypothetical protein
MDDWNNLEHALAGLLTAGNIEVHEDGEWLAELVGLHRELRRDGRVASLTTAPDLEHSFSGVYSRGLLVERGKVWTVLGVSGAEDAAAVDGARPSAFCGSMARASRPG